MAIVYKNRKKHVTEYITEVTEQKLQKKLTDVPSYKFLSRLPKQKLQNFLQWITFTKVRDLILQ